MGSKYYFSQSIFEYIFTKITYSQQTKIEEFNFMKKYFNTLLMASLLGTTLYAELITTYFDKEGKHIKAETNYALGTRTDMKEGVKEGVEKVYYEIGQVAYVVNYVDGKRDGIMTWYDKQGRLLSTTMYNKGKLEGKETSYYPNGKVKSTVTYINDKKEGYQKEYFDNGVLALEVLYVDGKKEGIQKEYTYDGKLYTEVPYKNNYKEGTQKWYDKSGKVIHTDEFKRDVSMSFMKKLKANDRRAEKLINNIDFTPQKPRD